MLQSARKASGLTQVQLAKLLGRPQSFVSKSERGERRVDFTELLEFAEAMKLDVDEFLHEYRDRVRHLKPPAIKRARRE